MRSKLLARHPGDPQEGMRPRRHGRIVSLDDLNPGGIERKNIVDDFDRRRRGPGGGPLPGRRNRGHHAAAGSGTRAEQATRKFALLSEREREIATAVAKGLSNAEISAQLHLSAGTVKAHVSSALAKLDLANRIQLALLAHDAKAG